MPVLRIGSIDVSRVEVLRMSNPIASLTEDRGLIEANRSWLAPHYIDQHDRFDFVFQSFVFEADGKVVLVDPSAGNHRPHPITRPDVSWLGRLEAAGYSREDIDIVMCTHLHHGYCGWNTMLQAGRWVPTFPKARYVLARGEVDRWDTRHVGHQPDDKLGVFERSVLPVLEAGQALVHDGHLQIGRSLEVLPAPGHTPGHCWLQVMDGEACALFSGDTFHHPLQLVEPQIQFGGDDDLAQALATRHQLVELAALRGALIVAAHLPAPHGLKVRFGHGGPVFTASAEV